MKCCFIVLQGTLCSDLSERTFQLWSKYHLLASLLLHHWIWTQLFSPIYDARDWVKTLTVVIQQSSSRIANVSIDQGHLSLELWGIKALDIIVTKFINVCFPFSDIFISSCSRDSPAYGSVKSLSVLSSLISEVSYDTRQVDPCVHRGVDETKQAVM